MFLFSIKKPNEENSIRFSVPYLFLLPYDKPRMFLSFHFSTLERPTYGFVFSKYFFTFGVLQYSVVKATPFFMTPLATAQPEHYT